MIGNLNLRVIPSTSTTDYIRLSNAVLNMQKEGKLRQTSFYFNKLKRGKFVGIHGDPTILASQIDKMITVLNRKMGENWEITLRPFIRGSEITYQIIVTLLYPSITISNSEGFSREIKDLLVSFKVFTNFTEEEITFGTPFGCRATLEYEEWFSHYQHSHLNSREQSSYSDCFINQEFCIGSGTELSELLADFWDEDYRFDDVLFEAYLYAIDTLVEWESLEGTPYMLMKRVAVVSSDKRIGSTLGDYGNTYYYNLFKVFLNKEKINSLNFICSEDRFIIKNDISLHKTIKDTIINNNVTNLINNVLCVPVPGQSYYLSVKGNNSLSRENLSRQFKSPSLGQPSIFIQGRELVFTVLPLPEMADNNEEDILTRCIVHPNFIEYARAKMEKTLFDNCIRKSTIKAESQSSDA